jgi:SAM-dependent methyltransferase
MTAAADKWDAKYAGDDFFYGTEPNTFLVSAAGRLATGSRILSLGEGEGRNGVYLAGLGHDVVATDQSVVGLRKAQALARRRGVTIATVAGDLASLPIDAGAWDAIVSLWCHLPGVVRRPLHRAVAAGLAPGGLLILESYHPAQIGRGRGGPSDPDLMPTLDELRHELPGLEVLHAAELEREVSEGEGHQGLSAVVQFIARRPVGVSGP